MILKISAGVRMKLMAGFIAISLCVPFFYLSSRWAFTNGHNTITPFAFTGMIDGVHSEHFAELGTVWKPRVAGLWLSAECIRIFQPQTLEQYQDVFGAYNMAWFGLTLGLLIVVLPEPVFAMMAVFAGTVYAISVTTYNSFNDDVHILPWDFPAMFFWTLAFILWQRKHFKAMVIVIIIGTLFKESVALLAVLLFFNHENIDLRWTACDRHPVLCAVRALVSLRAVKLFGAAFAGCLAVKLFITQLVLGQPTIFTAGHSAENSVWASTARFLKWELHPHLNTILWANGGLTLAVFFLPLKSLEDRGIRFLLVCFYFFLTVTPIIDKSCYEVRHWTDCLPMLAIYFQRRTSAWALRSSGEAQGGNE
ncbi:MAG TPA: hypothetical protein VGI03_15220 [Verrucomicrobiae bacterium]|jgi:hypothetical protein